ncbi:hypothetical protein ACQPYA_02920 [Micromonospora sp. CA-263727]|uniref:hypothetical protein n=1 Tax=Micromonospora sp. CA-263727 TaxID=3239967 RepID=UPI003D9023B8
MPAVAFARPMWPATLRALRELTRLALATLVLAVGLGAPSGLPDRPATDLAARSAASQPDTRPAAIDLPARPIAATVALRPADGALRVADAHPVRQVPAFAPTAPPTQPGHTDIASAPAAAILAYHFAVPRTATGPGEPTRRGPPTA